ncbi:hypothetical protein, partial [Saccharopolyspora sp. NPDC002578]
TSAVSSLRDLFSKWLRHEGKSCPREETAENPLVVFLLWWSLLSGFAADKTLNTNAAQREGKEQRHAENSVWSRLFWWLLLSGFAGDEAVRGRSNQMGSVVHSGLTLVNSFAGGWGGLGRWRHVVEA